jgi:hypothetical protein
MAKRWSEWFWALVGLLGTNVLTLLGGVLTTISALLIIAFLILGVLQITNSPYVGILAFLALPAVFIAGLLIIPLGFYWDRRRRVKRGGVAAVEEGAFPRIDFNKPRVRHLAGIVSVLTVLNILIISIVSYEGVVYMDTVQFCGRVCHTVMKPEYTAYVNSPHARVECVACHIGAGAPWFVRSKLSGVGQVFAVTFNTYDRPIPAPVKNLRPSRETCEECHWPSKFTGERIRIIDQFASDEANTAMKTVLLMHIGGGPYQRGIHGWHMNPRRQIHYVAADRDRQKIPWVQVRDPDGKITEYSAGESRTQPAGEERLMDCIDCHNRPTHIFQSPSQGMNQSLAEGRINRNIPFIKKVGVEALEAVGKTAGPSAEVGRRIKAYYESNYADYYKENQRAVGAAILEAQAIYDRNVFPHMRVTWGTYPDNIGHDRFPGCFRCHDSEHLDKDGDAIPQDCDTCHTLLADEETRPKILTDLGIQ